jgi:2,4-dienoyl-CoA reductase-like NADH-dependent reductase (Old Yellow Enzyme family)/thioredoxin reductase
LVARKFHKNGEELSMVFEHLLRPGRIGSLELKNRMIMPGMGTNLAAADGTVSDAIVNYYARRANGGVGLIITEVCCPDPLGRVIPGEIEITSNHFMPGLSRIPHAVHSGGAKICLQLAHGGCFASEGVTGQRPITPSGVGTMQLPGEKPRTMSIEDIKELIQKYGDAAKRARDCGFDAVELHGAHGYMPLQFLSAYTNRRKDEYGGSLENRARFALETIRAIKGSAGKDFTLIYRLSADEDVPGGVTISEACVFAKMAENAGADAIHVSAGTWDSRLHTYNAVMAGLESPVGKHLSDGVATSMWVPPNYTRRGSLVHLAAAVKKAVSVPVVAVCSITPEMGEDILKENGADFIAIGRQTIADPDYPKKIFEGSASEIRRCLRCNECLGEVMRSNGISCAVNAEAGKEYERFTAIFPAASPKKVAVIGGGPAGMQATQTAAKRGHKVTLFEKNAELGGALYFVALPDFKLDYKDYMKYMIEATKTCGAIIKTGRAVTVDEIREGGFDVVIVATGASISKPDIEGNLDPSILDPLKVLDGETPNCDHIIVCGAGLVGCEVAMHLAQRGKKVTMIDMLPDVAPDMAIYTKWALNSKLAELGVKALLNHRITKMTGKRVVCEVDGKETTFDSDAVVCALGLKPVRSVLENLREILEGIEIIPVGDVNSPRKIMQAIHEGFHAARRI